VRDGAGDRRVPRSCVPFAIRHGSPWSTTDVKGRPAGSKCTTSRRGRSVGETVAREAVVLKAVAVETIAAKAVAAKTVAAKTVAAKTAAVDAGERLRPRL